MTSMRAETGTALPRPSARAVEAGGAGLHHLPLPQPRGPGTSKGVMWSVLDKEEQPQKTDTALILTLGGSLTI